jgi:hypothetical protein
MLSTRQLESIDKALLTHNQVVVQCLNGSTDFEMCAA